ncbi:MAG: hypothetical protein GQ477_03860 [Nanohaloarchaea archaeon]|nr:hypothetical protein [Candidatus Nanohaloarchaea archaeon]
MGILLFMGAMAVASSVVVMSLGTLDKKDERLEYKGTTISDKMDYGSAIKLQEFIQQNMDNLEQRIKVLNMQISHGAYHVEVYENKKDVELSIKKILKGCENSYQKLVIRDKVLTKIIKEKENTMYPTSATYVSRSSSNSGFGA